MAKYARNPECRHTAFDELDCTTPYHRELIERWKGAVPFRFREYLPESKTWRFTGQYREVAIALLLEVFPDAEVPIRWRSRTRWGDDRRESQSAGSDHFAVLHLRPTAPRELIDAAYRALAKLHHPDKGGNALAMRQLIEAHEALSRRLSA